MSSPATTSAALFHPALFQLLRSQSVGRVRRLWRTVSSPRNLVPTLAAVVLAVLWMGNVLASLMFRDPHPPREFRTWVGLALSFYALWHVLKVAWMRPEEDIGWSPAERGVLFAAPFDRRQLLTYRLCSVLASTLFKSLLLALLLLPDLPNWPVGLCGLLLAFGFLELLRMVLEIGTCGMRPRSYFLFRLAVFGVAVFAAVVAVTTAIELFPQAAISQSNSMVHLLGHLLRTVANLRQTWLGRAWGAPFAIFGEIIVAQDVFSLKFVSALLTAAFVIGAMVWLVFRLDEHFTVLRLQNEQQNYNDRRRAGQRDRATEEVRRPPFGDRLRSILCARRGDFERPTNLRLARIARLRGAGPLFWRQWLGAMKHKGGLLIVFAAPAFLSLLPLLMNLRAEGIFYNVVAALVFYSFLLLPAALKFDFRRDFDRLYILKSLPLRPAVVVIGQLAAPVALTTLFQLAVMGVALLIRPLPLTYLWGAVLLLVPVNVAIFAVENLIFLLSPHRQNQEGIEVFLRTILVFTAKALLFVVGLSAFLAWGRFGPHVYAAVRSSLGFDVGYGAVFLGGILLCVGTGACAATALLVRTFRRFDPSLDFPG